VHQQSHTSKVHAGRRQRVDHEVSRSIRAAYVSGSGLGDGRARSYDRVYALFNEAMESLVGRAKALTLIAQYGGYITLAAMGIAKSLLTWRR
jgi:hypothetical protein